MMNTSDEKPDGRIHHYLDEQGRVVRFPISKKIGKTKPSSSNIWQKNLRLAKSIPSAMSTNCSTNGIHSVIGHYCVVNYLNGAISIVHKIVLNIGEHLTRSYISQAYLSHDKDNYFKDTPS